MSEIAVLSNPSSGSNRTRARRRMLRDLRALTRQASIDHVTPPSASDLPAALERLATSAPRLLAIDGGDGTVVAVVTALRCHKPFQREPMLAVLPGGSTNMIARDLGSTGRPAGTLRRLLDRWEPTGGTVDTATRQPLLVQRTGKPPCYGFFLGGGAIPRITTAARQDLYGRGISGPLAWSLTLGWSLWRLSQGRSRDDPRFRPVGIGIACDDDAVETRARLVVAVTTLDRLLLGLRPLPPGAGPGVAVVNAPATRLWRRIPGLLRRRWPAGLSGQLGQRRCRSVELTGPEGWVLDGETVEVPDDGRLTVQADAPLSFVVA